MKDTAAGTQRLWISAALTLSLLIAAAGIPGRLKPAVTALTHLGRADTWTVGSHSVMGRDVHDALVAADTLLPVNAVVLLLTSGTDPRHSEYIFFHRALYLLAPRPVWWATPAKPDGTWESRWWIETAPDVIAINQRAESVGASHVLSLGENPWTSPANNVIELPGGVHLGVLSRSPAPARKVSEWRPAPRPVLAVVAVAVVLLAGWSLLSLLTAPKTTRAIGETIAMSWLLGCGGVSLAMFWMISVGLPPFAQRIAIVVIAGVGVVGAITRRRLPVASPVETSKHDPKPMTRVVHAALASWLVIEVAALFLRSIATPLAGWDGWVTWAMKARMLHLQPGGDALLMDASREMSNRTYPLLLPLIESWLFGWIGAADDRFAAVITLSFLIALVVLLVSAVRSRLGLAFALGSAVALVTTPYAGLLASLGYADIALATYALAGAVAIRRWMNDHDSWPALPALLIALMPWVKTEGIVLSIALVGGAFVMIRAAPIRRRLVIAAALSLLVSAVPWYIMTGLADVRQSVFSASPVLTPNRLVDIAMGFGSRAASIDWHGLWLACAAALTYLMVRRQFRSMLPIAICLYVGAIAFSFFFSHYDPVAQHVIRSADRLLLHVAPLVLLMIADLVAGVRLPYRQAASATAEPHAGHPSG